MIAWHKLDQGLKGLPTDEHHEIQVQREAIPIVFVPGIMGSRLQRKGQLTLQEQLAALPRKRWDPSSPVWMALYYLGAPGGWRKKMLIGDRFSSNYLEVISDGPDSDGFEGIMEDYVKDFLTPHLRGGPWSLPLRPFFDLPVYACGFNWTDQVENAGKALADRIKQIKTKAAEVTGVCEKVIVVTHSMGGLVARWASEHEGAKDDILGIIHGVQPATGSPAAYWRMKAGFEDSSKIKEIAMASVLGNSADVVTPVLGNMPGGLALLPNKLHRTDDGKPEWLRITKNGQPLVEGGRPFQKPESDPYEEIYSVPAVVRPDNGNSPSGNAFWGLVDPGLLDPGLPQRLSAPGSNNALASQSSSPWGRYLRVLRMAKKLHDQLHDHHHEKTFCSQGTSQPTPNVVEMKVREKPWLAGGSYPNHGFRGFYRDENSKDMMAVLQEHSGDGDGTVPRYSSGALNKYCKLDPAPVQASADHQGAYGVPAIRDFTIRAIVSLCEQHFIDKHG